MIRDGNYSRRLGDARTLEHSDQDEKGWIERFGKADPASRVVAAQVTEGESRLRPDLPAAKPHLDASLNVAATIAAHVFDKGLARVPRPVDIEAHLQASLPGARMRMADVRRRPARERQRTATRYNAFVDAGTDENFAKATPVIHEPRSGLRNGRARRSWQRPASGWRCWALTTFFRSETVFPARGRRHQVYGTDIAHRFADRKPLYRGDR